MNTPSRITKLKSLAALAAALFTVSLAGFGSQVSAQSGPIVNVSTEGELQQAIAAISSDTTILISPGTYHLTSTLAITKPVTNVVLRGATENPNDVVISGRGMDNAHFEAVPHGISTGVGVTGITIANLTVRDVYYHAIMLAPGTESPRIQNVRLIDAGRQFVKAYPDGKGGGVDEGLIERSVFEYTRTSRDSETGGLEVHTGSRWTVRDNIFRNIVAPTGQVAGPAILFWYGSRDTVIERNTFINAQREIALGSQDRTPNDHSGGVVRNNFLYRESGIQGGQPAIYLADSPNTQVLHNTILGNGTATSLIQYRYRDTRGVVIRNNLLDGQIAARSLATGTVADNHTGAAPSMFVNAAAGDLHLASGPADIVDRAPVQANAGPDIDGEARPLGAAADFGADEYPGGVTSAAGAAAASGGTTSIGGTATLAAARASGSSLGALPSPWQTSDVGNPQRAGAASWSSGVFAADGAGTDIGNRADQFRFIYQTLDGDGEVVARVDSLERTDQWAKAGVMIRDELTTGAKHVSALVTASRGTMFQRRIANDAVTTQTVSSLTRAPVWLKIVRKGNAFTGFQSTDGTSWKQMGSEVVYLNRLAYVGLVLTSRSPDNLSTATFSNVKVTAIASAPNKPPSVSLTAPDNGASYTTPATMNVSASASDTDGTIAAVEFYSGSTLIGSDSNSPYLVTWNNAPAGTHTLTAVARDNAGATTTSASRQITISTPTNKPPSVTLTGPANGGAFNAPASIAMSATASDSDGTIARVDFYGGSTLLFSDTSSPYTWTWSNVAVGNYTVTAIASDNSGATATSAAAQIAVTTPANQPPTVTLTSPTNGATFAAPAAVSMAATAADMNGSITKVEFYAGSTLVSTDTSNPYSATWNSSTAGTFTLSAKAFDNAGASTISSGVNVTIAAQPVPPAPTQPTGWKSTDIGSPWPAGSASFQSGTFTVASAGRDVWDNSDQFHYVYWPLEGDGAIATCVQSVDFADAWTKAGLMIRGSLSPSAPYAYAVLSAGAGLTFQFRPGDGQPSQGLPIVAGVAPHCVRIARTGNLLRAFESLNGTNWKLLGEQTIDMPSSAFIGLAVTSAAGYTSATARFTSVTLETTAPSQAPQVTLTAPANGTAYTTPATMTLSANASDTDGTIVDVEFYAGSTRIGSDSSSPYSVTWSNAPSGTHILTAVARDDSGATTTSGSRQVTIAASSNTPPTVSLTSPTNGATFAAPAAVSVTASATDMNGTITKVEFYAGSTLVSTDMSSPYSATWNNSTAGTFTLSAKAFDNAGASTISSGVNVTIAAQPVPPTPTVPTGWQSADIGGPWPAGSASLQSGTFTVTAAGSDIWGNSDQLHYVYWPLQGDGGISTCVQSVGFADAWTKAGVMIRGSLSASAPHAFAMLSAGNGATFLYRPGESQPSAHTPNVPAVAPHCVRIVRSGNVFRAYESLNGTDWNLLGEQAIAMPSSAVIGLALSSATGNTTSTAKFSNVSLEHSTANQPPQVTLTTPANNASFAAPGNVQLAATATDADGAVQSVSFYANGAHVGTPNAAPWSMTWSSVPAGTYSITAVARDNAGATRTSSAASITVSGSTPPPTNPLPTNPPRGVVFNPSSNHDSSVNSYIVEFFASGANTSTATPVRTQDVGKPTPVSGEISVDVSATIQALPTGSYVSTVRATGPGGTTRSAPSQPFVR